jgi:hypothetical protein
MKIKKYTTQEWFTLFKLLDAGETNKAIATQLGRKTTAIVALRYSFRAWKEGKGRYTMLTHSMQKALNEYYKPTPPTNGKASTPSPIIDMQAIATHLKTAEADFIAAIVDMARAQVAEEHKREIADVKRNYEAKLKHYQELLLAAQDSSMVGVIKKRLGIPN